MRRGALVVALVVAVLPGRSDAFVRRLNSQGHGEFWKESCVSVTIYLNGFDKSPQNYNLDVAGIVKSVAAAAHAWSTDGVTCTAAGDGPSFEIVPTLAPLDAKPPPIGYDARNTIVFRLNGDWQYQDSDALAHTTVTPSMDDAHILDADIEVNAATPGLIWMNLDPGVLPPPDPPQTSGLNRYFDLQAVLTHEFGHFIGLAHTCYRSADGVQLRDNTGTLIPDCTPSLDPTSVMFPTIEPGETRPRTLTPDDDAAACTIYDPARDAVCALDTPPAGCATAPPRRPSTRLPLGAAVAVGVALVALARRGRRARVSDRDRARA